MKLESLTPIFFILNIELGNVCRDAGESGLKVLDTLEKGKIYTDLLNSFNTYKAIISLIQSNLYEEITFGSGHFK